MFYLSIKIYLCSNLYQFIDYPFDKEDENQRYEEEQSFKEIMSYIKVITEILIFFINNNKKKELYCLLSSDDFSHLGAESNNKILYYINQMNINYKDLSEKTGYIFETVNFQGPYYQVSNEEINLFENLFYEMIEKILRSKCMEEIIEKLNSHHQDINNLIKIDNDFIHYVKKNIIFEKLFKKSTFVITNIN